MKKLEKILSFGFSFLILFALLGGFLVFGIFLFAFLVGGEEIALIAKNSIMTFFIRTASLALALGLVTLYIKGEHPLTLD